MSIFHILSGKVSRVNYLRRVATEDFNKIKTIPNMESASVFLDMAVIFGSTVMYELFNPDNDILIKYAKDINENDIRALVCVLVTHYLFNYKNTIDIINTAKIIVDNLNYSQEEVSTLIESLENMIKNNNIQELGHPTIKLIIKHGHANYHPILNNKIITILINAHNQTKEEINSALRDIYSK